MVAKEQNIEIAGEEIGEIAGEEISEIAEEEISEIPGEEIGQNSNSGFEQLLFDSRFVVFLPYQGADFYSFYLN